MTQIEHEPAAPAQIEPPVPQAASPAASPSAPPYRIVALALGGALVLVVALVVTGPLWAPRLPWRGAAPTAEGALAAQLEGLATAQQEAREQAGQQAVAVQQLDRRIAALEARPVPPTGDIAELHAQAAKLAGAVADLTARVAALDKAARSGAAGATDTGLALVLLQIRGAIAAGRPFAAEYATLAALAHDRTDIAAAAAPLAEPAKAGVASRAVLAQGLRELARTISSAAAPAPAASGWADAALARLRGLVTIRRIADAAPGGRQNPVAAAELALAGGDLAGAIATLDKSSGAAADAAGPWLRMARRRLAVETALQQVEALLTAHLGAAAPRPGG
jgi:hypothetical protein